MMMVFAPVSSGLIRSIGAKPTLMIGAIVLGLGYVVALVLMDAPWQLLVASCVASAGVGIGYAAMPTLILDAVPVREAGSAVGVNGLMRSVGTTLAAAVMATVLTSSTTPLGGFALPTEGAFQLVLRRRGARRVRRGQPSPRRCRACDAPPRVATGSTPRSRTP